MNKLIPYNKHLKPLARTLRRQGILSEVILWQKLQRKSLGVEFHRQLPINKFIVDFYCHEIKLAIEIDGASHRTTDGDVARQQQLELLGVRFIRFTDEEIRFNTYHVLQAIQDKIAQLSNQ